MPDSRSRFLPVPRESWGRIIFASITGTIVLAGLALLSDHFAPMLWFGFGATLLLVLLMPNAPVSHPTVVIGGHLVTTSIGLVAQWIFPITWWAVGLTFGVALFAMAALRVVHPPAVSIPIALVLQDGDTIMFLLFPVLTGVVVLVLVGKLYHWGVALLERRKPRSNRD